MLETWKGEQKTTDSALPLKPGIAFHTKYHALKH